MITFVPTKRIKGYCSYPTENPVPSGAGVDTTGIPKLNSLVCGAGAVLLNQYRPVEEVLTYNQLGWSLKLKPSCTRYREYKPGSWTGGYCLQSLEGYQFLQNETHLRLQTLNMGKRGMEENKFQKCQWALRVKMLARSQIGITLLYSKLLEVLVKKHFIKMFLKAHSRGFEDTGQFFWGQTEKEFISISKIWSCLAQGGDLNEVRSLTARDMMGYGYDLRPQVRLLNQQRPREA